MENELLMAKGRNWVKLVTQRADKICELHKNDEDLTVKILTGQIFDEAVEQIALEIKCGLYDSMLMPQECNL